MVLSDAELRAIKILRREAAMWPRGRWMILVLSVGALLFGLLPWTRVILGADVPAEALRGVPSNMLLPVAVLWAEQSIATDAARYRKPGHLRHRPELAWEGRADGSLGCRRALARS